MLASFSALIGCAQDNRPGAGAGTPGTATGRGSASALTPDSVGTVVFLGTSLTAGYGLDPDQAYPALIRAKIDSANLPYRVVNAGVNGETSAGGLSRLDWTLRSPVDILVIELGANDGLRGLDVTAMRANLDSIIVRTRRRYPSARILLLGMEAPPNLGRAYTTAFQSVFADLARERGTAFVPFLLEGVAADPSLNLADGIHPNARGHHVIASSIWPVLENVLRGAERGTGS